METDSGNSEPGLVEGKKVSIQPICSSLPRISAEL